MIVENKKYYRLSLAKIEERLKLLLDGENEINDELASELTKRVENKIDLVNQ